MKKKKTAYEGIRKQTAPGTLILPSKKEKQERARRPKHLKRMEVGHD